MRLSAHLPRSEPMGVVRRLEDVLDIMSSSGGVERFNRTNRGAGFLEPFITGSRARRASRAARCVRSWAARSAAGPGPRPPGLWRLWRLWRQGPRPS